LSSVKHGSFMSITLTSIYLHHWKSFMKFGSKKSHEMISYNLFWIASLSEWEYGMSTQTLQPCSNSSNSTHEQKSWKVRVERMSRKCLNRSKTLIPRFIMIPLWPRLNNCLETSYEVWPLRKVKVSFECYKLCSRAKSENNLEASQIGARISNPRLFSDLEIF